MQDTAGFLAHLRALDIRISLEGDRLKVDAPKGAVTGALKEELLRRKPEIIELLSQSTAANEDQPVGHRVRRDGPLPLSHAQRRLWFLHNYPTGTSPYNLAGGLRFAGPLNLEALRGTFQASVERHESLRTCFETVDGAPEARLLPAVDFPMPVASLEDVPAGEARESALRELALEFSKERFELSRAPLIRAKVIRMGEEDHVLVVVVHHIIADGWSLSILCQELAAAYPALAAGRRLAAPPLECQFFDYVDWFEEWMSGGRLERQLQWWRKKLAGPPPVVELPTDFPRPALMRSMGGRFRHRISPELTSRLDQFAKQEGVTLFMLFMAAFNCLLWRYTGQTDLVVGSANAGRPRAEFEHVIGLFINTLVLRTDLSGNPTVRELLARVRNIVLDSSAQGEIPFDRLVAALQIERELNRPPLVQVMLTYHSFPKLDFRCPDVTVKPFGVDAHAARLDLTVDIAEDEGGFEMDFEANTELFEPSTIARLQRQMEVLLDGMSAGPLRAIGSLPLESAEEWAARTPLADASRREYPRDKSTPGILLEAIARHPGAITRCGSESRTFAETERVSASVAAALLQAGVPRGGVVAVCLERSIQMPAALLGIMRAGAAYVPLDPAYPEERLRYMIEDSGACALLTDRNLSTPVLAPDLKMLSLQELPDAATLPPGLALPSPDDLAYILYTSGSTGRPKGVEIPHRALVNFLYSMLEEPGLQSSDRLVAVTTLCFDISGLEMYLPLLSGAGQIIAPRAVVADGAELGRLIDSSQATVMQATPATWQILLDQGWSPAPGFKALCGGEAMPRELANALLAAGCEVWNLYGPTETTIWSAAGRVTPGEGPVPIGVPIANTTLHVLDENGHPAPPGVIGELCIGGDGLARGYHNHPEMTLDRFVTVESLGGERVYRTGDLARWKNGGKLELLGRLDSQVKIRGFRVELAEVEAALARVEAVQQAVVVAHSDGAHKRLDAYVVPVPGGRLEAESMRQSLSAMIPEYMTPSTFTVLPRFPLTLNGKVDRKALPKPDVRSSISASFIAPRSDGEREVASIWSALLGVDRVGVNDNFFDLGGHSLLVVQLQARLQRACGREVSLVELFQRPTVAAMARLFDGVLASPAAGSIE